MKKKQSQQNKQLFSKGRVALLTLLASLGVVTAVGMNRTPVHNDGPDNPTGTKEVVVESEFPPEMYRPKTVEEAENLIKMADDALADLDARLASGRLSPEERYYARLIRESIVDERDWYIKYLVVLKQVKSNGGR